MSPLSTTTNGTAISILKFKTASIINFYQALGTSSLEMETPITETLRTDLWTAKACTNGKMGLFMRASLMGIM